MMTSATFQCTHVVDCSGLHEIANISSNNLKKTLLDHLSSGKIGVPGIVWQEFKEIYEDEADQLKPYITNTVRMNRAYTSGAATIADKANSRFSLSPYDRHTDLYAASICSIEGCKLLTAQSQVQNYPKIKGVDVCTIEDIANE